jgi:uncharacterized repeat protein (TIGR01451 family)
MKRMFGLVTLGVVVVGWAALAFAQTPQPPAPVPAPISPVPAPLPFIQNGIPTPAAPVMPATPGTVPVPVVPVTPVAPAPAPSPVAPVVPMPTESAPATAALITGQPAGEGGMDAMGPTGRQEPAVSIEWIGQPAAKVGQVNDYAVVIRNVSNIPVQQVLVRVRLAGAANVMAADPKPTIDDNVMSWDVGTLQPKQEKVLQLKLAAAARGDMAAQAWVTFTGATALKVRVREPKLLVKTTGPERVMVGDATAFTVTVTNPGDGPAEHVKIAADLSAGLEHPRGSKVEFALGNLGAGESRAVQVVCLTKTGGEQSCHAMAEADGGLRVMDRAVCAVIMPRLDLEAKGPKLRYLDRKAVYTIKVTNPGDAPAANVTVSDVVPAGFRFVTADGGGQHDPAARTVSWFLGEVGPGQTREVNVELMCVATGEFTHKVAAQSSRGLKVEGETATRIEGLSALQLDVSDVEDPVELNGEAVYEIRVTNTGSVTETDVKVACALPVDKVQYKSATGPSGVHVEGTEVVFDPLPRLAPKADAVYKVTVKCTAAGTIHMKARVTSGGVTEPITKDETTRVYAD